MAAAIRGARCAVPDMHWVEPTGSPSRIRPVAEGGRALAFLEDGQDHYILSRAVKLAGIETLTLFDFDILPDVVKNFRPDLIVTRASSLRVLQHCFVDKVQEIKHTETLPVLFLDAGLEYFGENSFGVFDAVHFLFLRIRSLLRRERPSALSGIRREGGLVLNEAEFRLSFGEKSHDLTKSELCLIGPFFDSPETVFDRITLEHLAFDTNKYVSGNRQLDFHISRLRRSLRQSLDLDPLRAVRGRGYELSV